MIKVVQERIWITFTFHFALMVFRHYSGLLIGLLSFLFLSFLFCLLYFSRHSDLNGLGSTDTSYRTDLYIVGEETYSDFLLAIVGRVGLLDFSGNVVFHLACVGSARVVAGQLVRGIYSLTLLVDLRETGLLVLMNLTGEEAVSVFSIFRLPTSGFSLQLSLSGRFWTSACF